jgi:hypothetical protein
MALQITNDFKKKVVDALLQARTKFDGTDSQFAKKWGINNAVYSTLKTIKNYDGLLRDAQWLSIGRELEIQPNELKWVTAKTDVFIAMDEDIRFCQRYSKAMLYVDECGIGKTHNAKYLARELNNCFYVDGSQAKTKQQFIRLIARTIGVDDKDKYVKVKASIKYALSMLPQPLVIIDEAGDLEYTAFLELKELWNATADVCGWYMMGADGLRAKIERGINCKKVGYAEIFSRFSERFGKVVPAGKADKIAFYKKLFTDVLSVNLKNKTNLGKIVNKCLASETGDIGSLRRAKSILILNQEIA